MFDQLADTFLDLSKKSLLHLYKSLNQAQVSPGPGLVAQPASAFIFVLRKTATDFEVLVGLFFLESRQRVLYQVPPFAAEVVNEKVTEAEGFVGEMGFLMDKVRLSSLTDAEKQEIVRKIPFFYKDTALYQDSLSTSEIQVIKTKAESLGQKDAHTEMQKIFAEQYVALISML